MNFLKYISFILLAIITNIHIAQAETNTTQKGDACTININSQNKPGTFQEQDDAPLICIEDKSPNFGQSCGSGFYYNGSVCATTPAAQTACSDYNNVTSTQVFSNGTACVSNGSTDKSCGYTEPANSGEAGQYKYWQNGACVDAPAPPAIVIPSSENTPEGLKNAGNALSSIAGQAPRGNQQPICINSSPIVGGAIFGVVIGSTLCYGTAAGLNGTKIYGFESGGNSGSWDSLNVQDIYARGDITALGTLSVYGGARIYSPDQLSGIVVKNGQVLAASSNQTSETIDGTTSTTNNLASLDVTPTEITIATSKKIGASTTNNASLVINPKDITETVSDNLGNSALTKTTAQSIQQQIKSNDFYTQINSSDKNVEILAVSILNNKNIASTNITNAQIINKVTSNDYSSEQKIKPDSYQIISSSTSDALQKSIIEVNNQSIYLHTGNSKLATNGTSGITSGSGSGGMQIYQSPQFIAPNATVGDLLNGRAYQNKVNGNLFVDGNVYINGLLEYVSSNAASTTVTSSATSILGTDLATTGGTSIVMKGTEATHAVVDEKGQVRMVSGVSEQSAAALTVTNGIGNVHGFFVNETQATISGGVHSTSLTLDDNGATFSNSANGRPVQVHGVADGTAEYDAVNYRQLRSVAAGVASATAIANLPPVDTNKSFALGLGLGNYHGMTSIAFGLSARPTSNVVTRLSVATVHRQRKSTTVGAGLGVSW